MDVATRVVALGVAVALMVGLLAPSAVAQSPPTAVEQSPPIPPPTAVGSAPDPLADEGPPAGAIAGAVAINIFRIPGKAFLCGFGTIVAGSLMALTFGSQYRGAGAVFREGCGGKWVIGPSDLDRDVDAPKAIFSRQSY
jgi:hypothetical protein